MKKLLLVGVLLLAACGDITTTTTQPQSLDPPAFVNPVASFIPASCYCTTQMNAAYTLYGPPDSFERIAPNNFVVTSQIWHYKDLTLTFHFPVYDGITVQSCTETSVVK